jgi:hypothetical protein
MAATEEVKTVKLTQAQLEYLQSETNRGQAEYFLKTNPDYFICESNGHKLAEWLRAKKLPITSENLEQAKAALMDERKLIAPSRQTLAKMTADEVKQVAIVNGKARYDEQGNYLGSDFDPAWLADTQDRQLKALTRPVMSHPEDLHKKPTKKEFAMWSHERMREWLVATGHWGRELPDYLR